MIDIIAAIALTVIFGLNLSALIIAAPLTPAARVRFAVGAVLWLLGIGSLAALGVFAEPGVGTLAIGVAVLTPILIALIAGARSSAVRRTVIEMHTAVLVGIHASRLLGVFFLVLLAAGRLPPTFANAAGWGDIAVGALSLPLAWAVSRRVRRWQILTLLWNVLGFADLVTAVTLGIGSATGSPLRFIYESPESATIASLPWILIPGVLVPLYLMTHVAIFAQLRAHAGARNRDVRQPAPGPVAHQI